MDPFTVETTIAAPREQIFEYLIDVANHAEFSDHYLVDWHLLRTDSRGVGAGARFRVKARRRRFSWGDWTLAEASPHRIVLKGRAGKFNRVRMIGVYTLDPAAAGTTRVQFTLDTDPQLLSDRLLEPLGRRSWTRRQASKALRRLRTILEDGTGRGARPTVAAG